MTGIRGDRSSGSILPFAFIALLLLTGCGAAPPAGVQAEAPSASPVPTAACPQMEGVETPPDCVAYDPEQAMAQNDLYRQRMDISEEGRTAAEESIEALRPTLEALTVPGVPAADAVGDALRDAGLTGVDVREDYSTVLFAADGPAGGCIFGEVSAEGVEIEAGGYIMDGGCLPMQ